MTETKHIVWSNIDLDLDDWYDDLHEQYPALGEEGLRDMMNELNFEYFGDEQRNLDTKPTRSGYTFKGWATSSTATVASYQPGSTYTANANVTLYAVWSKNPSQYTVSYNANGGSGAPSSQTKTEGVTLTLSATKPTRSGYTFLGWSTSSTAISATYSAGGSYTANAGATLYAVWSCNHTTTSRV